MVRKKTIKNGFSRKRTEEKQAAKKQLAAFTLKFLLATLFIIFPLSLLPEDWYAPLNMLTAFLSGEILKLITRDTIIHGTQIIMGAFRANVISECSAIHLIAILVSFIYAVPSKSGEKLYGICIGSLFIFSVNIVRISLITIIGWQIPGIFDVVHIYLGQLVMIIIIIGFSLYWCQWISNEESMESPAHYLLRFLLFSTILLIIWLPLNRLFMAIVDYFVQCFFAAISLPVENYRIHSFYYQTFSLISLAGLLMAAKRVKLSTRIHWTIIGILVVFVFQFMFRICNVWISAYNIDWMVIFARGVYNLCVYAVPVVFALKLFMHSKLAGTKFPGNKTG